MKHEIEIEGLPEGWEPVEFRCPNDGESYIGYDGKVVTKVITSLIANDFYGQRLIVKKKQPRRIVLEETENDSDGRQQVFYIGSTSFSTYSRRVWKQVKEGDLSLNNADDKESLRLSVDECRKLLCNLDKDVMRKLQKFLKDK